MSSPKPRVGEPIAQLTFAKTDGDGDIEIGQPKDRWTLLIVYRGKHCPRCKRYLSKLNTMLADWHDLMDVVVVSADSRDKALTDLKEFGWSFDLCHGLTEDQMRALGLYVSSPLSEAETSHNFAEPGMFAIRPDGTQMLVDISNGPAARPDLDELLDGMRFNIENDRPARGLA